MRIFISHGASKHPHTDYRGTMYQILILLVQYRIVEMLTPIKSEQINAEWGKQCEWAFKRLGDVHEGSLQAEKIENEQSNDTLRTRIPQNFVVVD